MLLLSVFEFIIHSTVMGSIFALFILIFKFLFKKNLQIKLINCLWIFFIIRLLIPYAPQTHFSIYNLNPLFQTNIIQENNINKYPQHISSTNNLTDNLIEISNNYNSLKNKNVNIAKSNTSKNGLPCLEIFAIIWISVCIILIMSTFTTTTAFYVKLRKEKSVSKSELIEILNNCRQKMHVNKCVQIISTDIVKSPAIFGLIHPKILLPLNINDVVNTEQLSCIIFHELAHLKRKDIITDFVVSILKIMHWFNPIISYAFFKMNQDKELACDEIALNYCDCNKYGHTIIKLLEVYKDSNPTYGLDCIINNKQQIERRITMITLFKKNSRGLTLVSIAALLLIGGITLTNPKNIKSVYKNSAEKSSFNTIEELGIATRTFRGKILVIKNPSKVEVGYTKELLRNNKTTDELAKENKALCAINASYISTKADINSKRSLPETEFGIIVHNGNVIYKNSGNTKYNIAGFTDKNVLISGEYSIGASLYQLQQILLENGAYTAAVLDGGISSTMYYKGNIINKPASGVQSPISSIFMISEL